ncbi:MAG: hypothetical protein LC687_06985 [Actinobacteria bacterium]|nr:hypothetical protein [Actinomycetota bacterium]
MATAAIVLGSIAAAGTAYSVHQGRKAAKAQKRAGEVQRKQRLAEEARARRQQLSEARRKRAAVINATSAGGLQGSSGEVGGLGSLQANLGGNLGFMEQSSNRSTMFERFQQNAASANQKANTGSAIAGIAMQGASMFGPPAPDTTQPSGGGSIGQAGGTFSPMFRTNVGPRN